MTQNLSVIDDSGDIRIDELKIRDALKMPEISSNKDPTMQQGGRRNKSIAHSNLFPLASQ
jgi:hypothetical protein